MACLQHENHGIRPKAAGAVAEEGAALVAALPRAVAALVACSKDELEWTKKPDATVLGAMASCPCAELRADFQGRAEQLAPLFADWLSRAGDEAKPASRVAMAAITDAAL